MRVADYIVNFLVNHGIKATYAITGRGALFLNDALAKNNELTTFFPHHEQSAVYAACAAADLTRKLQAVVVSTGCASTNAVTGVLSAWQDHLPLIVISGQNTLDETTNYTEAKIRTYGQQEADIIPIVKSITKYAHMLTDAKEIRYHMEKAVFEASNGTPGPVWLDVPLDLQNAQVDEATLKGFKKPEQEYFVDKAGLHTIVEKLKYSSRPVFLIGSGIKVSNQASQLEKLSLQLNVPIVYSHSAVDCIPYDFCNTIGSIGSQGAMRSGAFAVQNADLVMVLGSRMNSLTTGPDGSKFAREAEVVVVGNDLEPHKANRINYTQEVKANISDFLGLLEKNLDQSSSDKSVWLAQCLQWKKKYGVTKEFVSTTECVDLHEFAQTLPNLMQKNDIFVCDSGFIDVIVPTNAPFKKGQRCIRPVSQGAMGFALPAVLGLAGNTSETIYCVVGDGSIMFNLQELETLKRYNANVKILVFVNDMYAVIKRRQNKLFRGRTIGVDSSSGLKAVKFDQISAAFGIEYYSCDADNYEEIISTNASKKGVQLYEIPGKVDQEYIEIYHAQTAKRKFVRRPLEDQKPFLSREEFLGEMLITPIDQ